ncbi:lytic transglycosylase domain-containing protein [Sphingomonas quercus]|uniref:lytic transglycosylase domain-containing protein n=1 Tax=Sphingomonas quercus TaxID=2842451 RepID=UPI00209B3FB5|nr:lytic transglycosylase domain-containing protein [Sphingomonas quercus]
MIRPLLIGVALTALAAPALAEEMTPTSGPFASTGPAAATPQPVAGTSTPSAQILTDAQRDGYRAIFSAIRSSRWDEATAQLDAMGDGPLHAVARAELLLAKGSPRASSEALSALLARAPDLPEAPQLAALLRKRGGSDVVIPDLPQPRQMMPVRGQPRRLSARSNSADLAAARLAQEIRPLVKEDRAGEMEGYLLTEQEQLSPEARTEWQQRIAWTYYLAGDDENALRLALTAGQGIGDFANQADWVAGLAAWRQDKCDAAGQAFQQVAGNARDDEMRAAGLFWSARADMVCRHPERVETKLRQAAAIPETFYGLIASRSLGIAPPPPAKRAALGPAEWSTLQPHSNAQAAVALVSIGELSLADKMIRWQAQIGQPSDHGALLHLASQLDLPATQIWLAHNSPNGLRPDVTARYPAPGWTPQNGWQVDRALVYAHTLQESAFRTDAVSVAGARGLMQVLPTTADLMNRRQGLGPADRGTLNDPSVNLAYGQQSLQWVRDMPATEALLPKVIAAFNAGPGAVQRWNPSSRDGGDPLLWIESIPYTETRAYVATVLRNYWMYQRQEGKPQQSLTALAQGMWPRFPGMTGADGVRIQRTMPAPVRMAVVMPHDRANPLAPDRSPFDSGVMVADASAPAGGSDAASGTPTLASVPATASASTATLASAPARALASAAAAGSQSLTVVKEVAKSLATPVVRARTTAPGSGLDAILLPILKQELPKARAGVKAITGVTAKASVR